MSRNNQRSSNAGELGLLRKRHADQLTRFQLINHLVPSENPFLY